MDNIIKLTTPPREPQTETEIRPITFGITMRITRPKKKEPSDHDTAKRALVIPINPPNRTIPSKKTDPYGQI